MGTPERLVRALAAIDAANADDPRTATVRGRTGPREVVHAEIVSEWVETLVPEPSEALVLAARGNHLRRWTSPRATFPSGRAGYLRWRKALHEQHATDLGTILATAGYDEPTIDRVQALVRKDALGRADADPDVQALEDALCLTFLETDLGEIVMRLDPENLARVVAKTAAKMSPAGRACIARVPLGPGAHRILAEAGAREVVQRYLDGLAAHDWDAVSATLATDVHRVGPYRDVCDGRETYATFLRDTITGLGGYELRVQRVIADGATVAVQLRETVDDGGERLATDETVVFGVRDGLIASVAVYLQTSERSPREG